MESIAFSAFLTVATFLVIAVSVFFVSGLTSTPKDGQLQPRFSARAQRCTMIACLLIVPVLLRFFGSNLKGQEEVNSILVSTNLLLAIWVYLISRGVESDGKQ